MLDVCRAGASAKRLRVEPVLYPSFARIGMCAVDKCTRHTRPLTEQERSTEHLPHTFCTVHDAPSADNAALRTHFSTVDSLISQTDQTYTTCASTSCKNALQGSNPFYPACSERCKRVVSIFQHTGSLKVALRSMSNMYMNNSVSDSSWKTYKTGTRAWLRFCFSVLRDHPNFAFQKSLCGSEFLKIGGNPPRFREDAEEQLMDFYSWLSLEGSCKPASAEGYVSAVKASHLIWNGFPFEASVMKFYRLGRMIRGLKRSIKSDPVELKEGLTHEDLHRWFQLNDSMPRGALGELLYGSEKQKLRVRDHTYPLEALIVCLWHLILRPDELIVTGNHESCATVDMITFFSPKGAVLPLLADYAHIGHVSLDLSRHGRKNDQAGSNLPLISAADHDSTGRHFCAAWQLHRLVHHMDPCGDLSQFPLFPVDAARCERTSHFGAIVPVSYNRSFRYDELNTSVKRMMRDVLSCDLKDPRIKKYTAYSPRIGGSIALCEAGADGITIQAIGQWSSNAYQLYLRTARHRALEWSIRVSRGFKARV